MSTISFIIWYNFFAIRPLSHLNSATTNISLQNRHWIKREADDGKKEVYEVYTVCGAFLSYCSLLMLRK